MTLPVQTIVTVDDHELFRLGIVSSIDQIPSVQIAAQGAHGDDISELVNRHKPDLLLLDLHMKYRNGQPVNPITEIRNVRKISPATKVVVVSGYLQPPVIHALFRNEITGYLHKEDLQMAHFPELIARALSGNITVSPKVEELFETKRRQQLTNVPPLTERQVEVLTTVAEHVDKDVAETAQILSINEQSLRNHLNRIYTIFGVTNRAACILRGIEFGYIRIRWATEPQV